jgi:peptidoglycan/LPS O-acetylase OafA/YrhL
MENYWGCLNRDECAPKDPRDPRILPAFFALPPVRGFWNSHVAVGIFFQLSGFVLPLNFFKKSRNNDPTANDSISSGMFRRYFRLMIPLLTAYSIYYFAKHSMLLGKNTYNYGPGTRTYLDIFTDGLFKTWIGENNWFGATGTLGTEFFGTYFVYFLAVVAAKYNRHSWCIYLLIFLFVRG